jgi:hypothetical protein
MSENPLKDDFMSGIPTVARPIQVIPGRSSAQVGHEPRRQGRSAGLASLQAQ